MKDRNVLTVSGARMILRMLEGESIGFSSLPMNIGEILLDENILTLKSRGSKKGYRMNDAEGCRIFLAQHYTSGMNLEEWIELKSRQGSMSRAEQVAMAGNSKMRATRTFKGFLVNSYTPIEATLRDEPFVIQPLPGTAVFVEDYGHFRIPEDVVVVGMENGENFQQIRAQKYLFEGLKILFVSRYPQSKDLCAWLQMIPNRYLHFGDFDLAGIRIYLTEFYASLGDRAEFFVPEDVEERLKEGNWRLYERQYARYKEMDVTDKRLLPLVEMIHRYRKGYEQEGYIGQE